MVGSTREPHFMIHVSYERKIGCQTRTLINQPGLTRASNWRDNKSVCQSMVWRLVIGRLGGEKLVLGKPASDIENHSNSISSSSSLLLLLIIIIFCSFGGSYLWCIRGRGYQDTKSPSRLTSLENTPKSYQVKRLNPLDIEWSLQPFD